MSPINHPEGEARSTLIGRLWEQIVHPVTIADRAGEEAIRAILASERPDDGIDGEEFGHHEGPSGWTWLLDPIDGTRAFLAGLPVWTTLIALADPDGNPVIGIIDQPVLGERYIGAPGEAWLQTPKGRTPLRVARDIAKPSSAVQQLLLMRGRGGLEAPQDW